MNRRTLLGAAAASAALTLLNRVASAQTLPRRGMSSSYTDCLLMALAGRRSSPASSRRASTAPACKSSDVVA